MGNISGPGTNFPIQKHEVNVSIIDLMLPILSLTISYW